MAADPFLADQPSLMETLFDRMPLGVAVLDRNLLLRRCNPKFTELLSVCLGIPASQVTAGASLLDFAPDKEALLIPTVERALAGETTRREGIRVQSSGVESFWDVVSAPLATNGETAGVLLMVTDATERRRAEESHRVLERLAEDRTRELSTLLEVSRHVAATPEVSPLLEIILDKLSAVVDYTGAWIFRLEKGELAVTAHRGPVPKEEAARVHFMVEKARIDREVVQGRKPLIISDTRGDDPLARSFQESAAGRLETTFGYIRSWMGVPVIVKDRVIGKLTLDHSQPNRYTPHDAALAMAFAEQAGLAIENARLRSEAEESAVAAERNRLARDLHDAVTQTLFSASLIAEVLPRLWERNPDEGRRRLGELRELTRGALAEMRTLLLELRPSVLREAALGPLLHQLAEATTGRARVPVSVEVDEAISLPPEVQVALYRIAQEALNNVAKHSGASHAQVSLYSREGQIELRVIDDGKGFDLGRLRPDSMGLGIMRERAHGIGAILSVESEPGRGTRITTVWNSESHL